MVVMVIINVALIILFLNTRDFFRFTPHAEFNYVKNGLFETDALSAVIIDR